jgi:hypothetical protein
MVWTKEEKKRTTKKYTKSLYIVFIIISNTLYFIPFNVYIILNCINYYIKFLVYIL